MGPIAAHRAFFFSWSNHVEILWWNLVKTKKWVKVEVSNCIFQVKKRIFPVIVCLARDRGFTRVRFSNAMCICDSNKLFVKTQPPSLRSKLRYRTCSTLCWAAISHVFYHCCIIVAIELIIAAMSVCDLKLIMKSHGSFFHRIALV